MLQPADRLAIDPALHGYQQDRVAPFDGTLLCRRLRSERLCKLDGSGGAGDPQIGENWNVTSGEPAFQVSVPSSLYRFLAIVSPS
ncbi:MAG: hypothetical protein OXC26_08025 [Albidovulum sp.]|nr:hypothetical protein [Albidovulum sp.]